MVLLLCSVVERFVGYRYPYQGTRRGRSLYVPRMSTEYLRYMFFFCVYIIIISLLFCIDMYGWSSVRVVARPKYEEGQCLLSKYRYQVSIPRLMLGIQTQVYVPIQSKCVYKVSLYIDMKLCILSHFKRIFVLAVIKLMERNKFTYCKIILFQNNHF